MEARSVQDLSRSCIEDHKRLNRRMSVQKGYDHIEIGDNGDNDDIDATKQLLELVDRDRQDAQRQGRYSALFLSKDSLLHSLVVTMH
jgi:hypothetical protein